MTAQSNDIYINPAYGRLFSPDILPRYVLFTGGRGSSKSFTVSTFLCDALRRYQNWKALFTRYTLTSAEISIIPEFSEKLDLIGVRDQCHVTKKTIEHKKTGSSIIFSGIKTSTGNQTAKLKSIPGLNVFVIDEGEEFVSEKDFNIIDDSIRVEGVPNLVVIIMNPQTVTHWIWDKWIKDSHKMVTVDGVQIPISTHPDILHIHTTYLDNVSNLAESYLSKIRKLREDSIDPKTGHPKKDSKYAHRFLGAWLTMAEGAIFKNWKEGEFDETLPYCFAMDEGFFPDPLTLAKIAVDKRRKLIYLKELEYKTELSTEEVKALFEREVKSKRELIVADDKGRLIGDLSKDKWNIRKAVKWPGSVKDQIRDIQDYTIIVTPESYNAKMELNNYVWNDKKASIPIDAFNHLLDPLRYGFGKLVGKRTGVSRKN
jgi:phage terminase large subunit